MLRHDHRLYSLRPISSRGMNSRLWETVHQPLPKPSILRKARSGNIRFGRGRWAVSQQHTLIRMICADRGRDGMGCNATENSLGPCQKKSNTVLLPRKNVFPDLFWTYRTKLARLEKVDNILYWINYYPVGKC